MNKVPVCFVIMPFRPELNFFYLYVKKYLEDNHGLGVERGDTNILTRPLMEKIREQILKADVIISDVTGSNPNVFYELGLAHAYNKPVIFLTQDAPKDAPVDIRQFEFIVYDLSKHQEFLSKLDNAIKNIFVEEYQELYNQACELLTHFNTETKSSYLAASLDEFQVRVMREKQTRDIPSKDKRDIWEGFILPKIVANPTDQVVMKQVTDWLGTRSVTT